MKWSNCYSGIISSFLHFHIIKFDTNMIHKQVVLYVKIGEWWIVFVNVKNFGRILVD
jgi:hypothetical protein